MIEEVLDPGVVTFQYTVPFDALEITAESVAAAMGYGADALSASFMEDLGRLVNEAADHTYIECGFRVFPPEIFILGYDAFRVAGTHFNTGHIIAGPLRGSESIAFFVATAGPGITAWSKALMEGDDHALAYFVDALGSVTVEKAADWLEDKITDWAGGQGQEATNRYSPGYCEWDVAEQHKFFSLLPDSFCGVYLTESSLMQPTKSVSGVIGIGHGARRRAHACAICTMVNCFRRNAAAR